MVNNALLGPFFAPKPLPIVPVILRVHQGYETLMASVITSSLRKCSSSFTPGPDTIPYSVCKREHLISPHLLPSLLDLLLKFGYHPPSMKKASGAVLDKPDKPFYGSQSSFKVIGVLQPVSKAHERMVTSRLALPAKSLKRLHHSPAGSLPALYAFDAVFGLVDTIRTLQRTCLKVTSVFLGLKGVQQCKGIHTFLLSEARWSATLHGPMD